MANPPPVIALAIPVLGWYTVGFGNIQTSQLLSVPKASFLSSPDGLNPGLTGVADGAMVHLAGITLTGDAGSLWCEWQASSLAVPDGLTIFNPWPSVNTPGRWIAQIPQSLGISRIVTTGAIVQLAPNTVFVAVRKTPPSVTTILLPPMTTAILGEPITIKVDSNAATFPTTVQTVDATIIDMTSTTTDVLNQSFQARDYTPDGVQWNRS